MTSSVRVTARFGLTFGWVLSVDAFFSGEGDEPVLRRAFVDGAIGLDEGALLDYSAGLSSPGPRPPRPRTQFFFGLQADLDDFGLFPRVFDLF